MGLTNRMQAPHLLYFNLGPLSMDVWESLIIITMWTSLDIHKRALNYFPIIILGTFHRLPRLLWHSYLAF